MIAKIKEKGFGQSLFVAIALLLSVFQIWSVIWGKLDALNQMAIHLSMILALTYLIYRFKKSSDRKGPSFLDYACVLLALSAGIYFTLKAEWIAVRVPAIDSLSSLDIFFGVVFVVLSMEAARRTIGMPIVLIIVAGLLYTFFGQYLGGLFYHRTLDFSEIINELAFSFNGLWGSPIAVAASFVFMFILMGAFLQRAGAGEFFFQLSSAIAGRTKGGSAKVAVLASAFFGSISGSPTANVVTTGAFTIPVSIKTGYKPRFAAAVEAAASTGGSILPPIMGSSAFLMAAVTQIPYNVIVLAAIIPGILYYVSLLAMVHFEAHRLDLPSANKEDIPRIWDTLKNGWYYFIPLIVLLYFLLSGYSASRTGFYGIVAIVIVSWLKKSSGMGIKAITRAMVDGAKSAVPVSTACAAAGLVIAGIMTTGLGGKLTSIVLHITDGMFIPTLILVMVICIILGMGMPVAAAYILTAMLAAPALIELGASLLSAHLFIVYFSIFSAITPPVAVAAFAAAGIARANPNKVGFTAVRLGIVGFIVPFLFVLNPALLMEGSTMEIVLASISALVGVVFLASGIIGWFFVRALLYERLLFMVSGLCLLFPDPIWSTVGFILAAVSLAIQYRRKMSGSHYVEEMIHDI